MSPSTHLRRARLGAVAAAIGTLCALPAMAAERYWGYAAGCGSADFTSTSCWRLGSPGNPGGGTVGAAPAAGDDVFLVRSGPDSLSNSFANAASPALPVYQSLTLWGSGGGVVGLNVVRNSLQVSGDTNLGDGVGSAGRIVQSGGTTRFNTLFVRSGSDVALSGGSMSLSDLRLTGTGTFNQTGGTLTANPGSLLFVSGRYFLDAGTLDIRNATFWSNLAGTLELGGGTLLTSAGQTVLASTVNFIGGDADNLRNARLIVNTLNVRNDFGYRMATFATDVQASALNVGGLSGNDSDANFLAGTHTVNGALTLSAAAAKTSRAFISNAGTRMTTQGLEIGRGDAAATGAGRMLVNAGTLVVNGPVNVGRQGQNSLQSALVANLGGQITVNGPLEVYGQVVALGAGSTVTMNSAANIGDPASETPALLTVDGATVRANGSFGVSFGSRVVLENAGTFSVAGTFINNPGANVQVLSGSTATFEGPYYGSGGVEIGAGSTVNFRGSIFRERDSGFTGTGTANYFGPVQVDMLSSSINDAGSFNLQGSAVTSVFFMDSMGFATGQLKVAGNLGFGGTLILITSRSTYALGTRYDLFDWGSTSGQFSAFDFSSAPLAAGLVWDTSELYTEGVLKVSAVPEPGSLAFLLAGLGAVGLVVARRRSALG